MLAAILTTILVARGALWRTQIARVSTGDIVLTLMPVVTTYKTQSALTQMLVLQTKTVMSAGSTVCFLSGARVMMMRTSHPL